MQYLINKLQIKYYNNCVIRLNIDINKDNNNKFAPYKKPIIIIYNILGRYFIESIFNKFLVNINNTNTRYIYWIINKHLHKFDPN